MPMWSSFWRNLATWPCHHEAGVGNKPKKSWLYRLTGSQWDNPKRTTVTRTNQTLSFGKFEYEPQEGIHDSLVVQWLRVHLPMQETWFNPWSGKIPHAVEQLSLCTTSTEPVHHKYWAHAPQVLSPCTTSTEPVHHKYWARVLQLLKPTCLEPMLCSKRSHCMRNLRTATREQPPLDSAKESPLTATKIQHSQ